MDHRHADRALRRLWRPLLALALALVPVAAPAAVLKLAGVPLDQVIELYARETGRNVFVDESVQQQRKVTVFLRDMTLEQAFGLIQKTVGLESVLVGTGTLVVFPPEKAARYRQETAPSLVRLPDGVDPAWVVQLLATMAPGLRIARPAEDTRALVVFGGPEQADQVRTLAALLPVARPETAFLPMTRAEATALLAALPPDGFTARPTDAGLDLSGVPEAIRTWRKQAETWRAAAEWGRETVSPAAVPLTKALQAIPAVQGTARAVDLGGTGALLIEGPRRDREAVKELLADLDREAATVKRQVLLADLSPEVAREVLENPNLTVKKAGTHQVVLSGRPADLAAAGALLGELDRRRRQVLIRFRLAEVARGNLKKLGIDLDRGGYAYDEIKSFHPKDTLPLLLKVVEEGKHGRILAEPNLRVIEGGEGRITIGDRIPLEVAATAQTDSGSTLKLQAQLSWIDVGIKMTVKDLAVKPDGSVQMNLANEVSSVVALTKQGYPQIRTREAQSSLRIADGGTVVMSGLLSDEDRTTDNAIPWFSRLPLIGGLGRSRNRETTETEIIMIVTAHVAPR